MTARLSPQQVNRQILAAAGLDHIDHLTGVTITLHIGRWPTARLQKTLPSTPEVRQEVEFVRLEPVPLATPLQPGTPDAPPLDLKLMAQQARKKLAFGIEASASFHMSAIKKGLRIQETHPVRRMR